jgi:hypothetical protein
MPSIHMQRQAVYIEQIRAGLSKTVSSALIGNFTQQNDYR